MRETTDGGWGKQKLGSNTPVQGVIKGQNRVITSLLGIIGQFGRITVSDGDTWVEYNRGHITKGDYRCAQSTFNYLNNFLEDQSHD